MAGALIRAPPQAMGAYDDDPAAVREALAAVSLFTEVL